MSLRTAATAALVGLAVLGGPALAQVFRIVGPDGKVTFTDRPPPDAKATPAPTVTLSAASSTAPGATLPAEVRSASSKFPVTLYTGQECGPCTAARNFLVSRGVPFTERTVTSTEDIQALGRIMGDSPRVPFATIGGQHVRGFSDTEWSQYLDAAGYPRTSQLPPSYRNPPPTPLVAVQPPPTLRPPQAQAQAQPQPTPGAEAASPSGPSPSNPAGIRF